MNRRMLFAELFPLFLLVVLFPIPEADAASFQGLGFLPERDDKSYAYGISADGSVVVGISREYDESEHGWNSEPFRWTAEHGVVGLGHLDDTKPFNYGSPAVSADGSVVVGNSSGEAFRWTAETGMVRLSFGPFATAVSADGSVVVGNTEAGYGYAALRWTAEGGVVGLGFVWADDISADGSVVAGTRRIAGDLEPALWTAESGVVGLGCLREGGNGWAQGISADGSVVVGISDREAFRWTAETGMVGQGFLPDGEAVSRANAVSADGSVVVGRSGEQGSEAFIWDAVNGMRSLEEVLINDHGLNLNGWELGSAEDISDDGIVIVGWGSNPAGQSEAWRAVIPEPASIVIIVTGGLCLAALRWPRFIGRSPTGRRAPLARQGRRVHGRQSATG